MKIIPRESIAAPQANRLLFPEGIAAQESNHEFYSRFCIWAANSGFDAPEYLLPQISIDNEIAPLLFEQRFAASDKLPPTRAEIDSHAPWYYYVEWKNISTIDKEAGRECLLFHRHRTSMFRDSIASLLGDEISNLTMVDVACSAGVTTLDFAEQGFKQVLGLEFREESVRQANFLKRAFDVKNVDFKVEDARNVDRYSADVVFCGGLLYHVTFPVQLVESLFSATRKMLILDSLCINHSFSGFHLVDDNDVRDPLNGDTVIQLVPSYRAIIDLLHNAGFRTVYEILGSSAQFTPLYNTRNVRSLLAIKPGVELHGLGRACQAPGEATTLANAGIGRASTSLRGSDNCTFEQAVVRDPEMSREAIEALVANRAFEAAKPYLTEGTELPPVCAAGELRAGILEKEDWFGTHVPGRILLKDSDLKTALAALEKDDLPIPAADNREGYGGIDHAAYWLWGFEDFTKVRLAAERLGVNADRVLDFGGSTGRVYRHFYTQSWSREVYACDFKRVSVNWCKSNFPSAIRVFLNSLTPTLPFPDGFFDVITAFSVFTHIDEFEDAWLLELSRVLRPGGMAYLTIHDENTWRAQIPALLDSISNSPEAVGIDLRAPMLFERRAFSYRQGAHYSLNMFHSSDYVKKYWGNYFTIESIEMFAHQIQAVIIARK